ncbi:hypothetical protein ACFE04_009932 [Oxalis oulophora]
MEFATTTTRFLSALLVASSIFITNVMTIDQPSCAFKTIFNFGDSNSDTGGISAAFYPTVSPSGETFFHKPSGRASDGRLIIDFIAQHLGLPYLSAYLDSMGTDFRHGANFATGGATVLHYDESWFQNGVSPFPVDIQVEQFIQFKARSSGLYTKVGNLPRPEDFANALYIFDIGQNDIAAGFRKTNYERFDGSVYDIANQISASVRKLYSQGARTFWIHNTGPLGCLALNLQYTQHSTSDLVDRNHCVRAQNRISQLFNKQLKNEVMKLRSELPNAALTYVDIFSAKHELIANAAKEGFMNPSSICCGYNEGETHILCGQSKNINGATVLAGLCKDPSKIISWDGIHYTEAANQWVTNHIISGSFSDPPQVPISLACHRT